MYIYIYISCCFCFFINKSCNLLKLMSLFSHFGNDDGKDDYDELLSCNDETHHQNYFVTLRTVYKYVPNKCIHMRMCLHTCQYEYICIYTECRLISKIRLSCEGLYRRLHPRYRRSNNWWSVCGKPHVYRQIGVDLRQCDRSQRWLYIIRGE